MERRTPDVSENQLLKRGGLSRLDLFRHFRLYVNAEYDQRVIIRQSDEKLLVCIPTTECHSALTAINWVKPAYSLNTWRGMHHD